MAGEKARMTDTIVNRIEKYVNEDTVVFLEKYQQELAEKLQQYQTEQENAYKQKIARKENEAQQKIRYYVSERQWKIQTLLRKEKADQISKLKEKAYQKLLSLLGSQEYQQYLERAKAKTPKDALYLIRQEDQQFFEGYQVEFIDLPLGGFKVDEGRKILDFTLESAFEEAFETFSKTVSIDE